MTQSSHCARSSQAGRRGAGLLAGASAKHSALAPFNMLFASKAQDRGVHRWGALPEQEEAAPEFDPYKGYRPLSTTLVKAALQRSGYMAKYMQVWRNHS